MAYLQNASSCDPLTQSVVLFFFFCTKVDIICLTGQQPNKITMSDEKFKMAAKIHIFTNINQKEI